MRDESGTAVQRGRKWGVFWPGIVGATVLLGCLAAEAATTRSYQVPSASMSPTLDAGDRVLVKSGRTPQRGEIWAYRVVTPGYQGAFIKRVVGLPGETVEVRNGTVRIDGAALSEPYIKRRATYSVRPRRLGTNEYYALGDNRDNSYDSHMMGPVSGGQLIGEARLRYWPLERAGGL